MSAAGALAALIVVPPLPVMIVLLEPRGGAAVLPKDRTLSEAADTLRRAIDDALKSRGDWLTAAP